VITRNLSYEVTYSVNRRMDTVEVSAADIHQASKAAEIKLAFLYRTASDLEILKIARASTLPVTVPEKFFLSVESTDLEENLIQIARNMVATPSFDATGKNLPAETFFFAALCLSDQGFELPSDIQEMFDLQYERSNSWLVQNITYEEERVPYPISSGLSLIAGMVRGEWRTQDLSWQEDLTPFEIELLDLDPDEGVDFEGSLYAYSYLLAVSAYLAIGDNHDADLVRTYERIKQPFQEANGLSNSHPSGNQPHKP
jgi:hypothetical protein